VELFNPHACPAATRVFVCVYRVSVLDACSGRDIVAKSSTRKSKYLFSFPGNLGVLGSGRIGEIAGMDTPNPTVYFEFPEVSGVALRAYWRSAASSLSRGS
jgi:hypothetical protein